MSKGMLIVIEGLDGSGKATQTKWLVDALRAEGKNVMRVTFPNYKSDSSALVKMYLSGEFGSKPGDVNAYAASSFYAVDRFASYKTAWGQHYENGGIVVADRYTTSNAIHQCAKLDKKEWDAYLEWLYEFEFEKLGLPRPDCVIYLDVPTRTSQKLMSNRYANDESKKDIHEKDVEYLNACKESAAYCTDFLGWERVICTDDEGRMRSIEDIAGEVLKKAHEIVKSGENA